MCGHAVLDGEGRHVSFYSGATLVPDDTNGLNDIFVKVRDEGCTPVPEVCNDGADNDCDGRMDCADSDCAGASCPNSAPVAVDQTLVIVGNTATRLDLSATDADSDPLFFIVVTPPAHGSLSGAAPNLTYRPAAHFIGPDSFTFKANDGRLNSNIATVSITVYDAAFPVVTIIASDATATEAGTTTGQYTVARTGATGAALTVNLAVGGTATPGSDYFSLGASVTIPAGEASATITLTPIDDTAVESDETVVVTLSAAAAFLVGSPAAATVTITSDDVAVSYVLWANGATGKAATWTVDPASGVKLASTWIGSAAGNGSGWQATSYVANE